MVSSGVSAELEVYQRMLERERTARREAERLIEEKSRELYEANRCLADALATQRREAYYQQVVLDSVTDGILTIGSEGRVQTANPGICRIFACPHDMMIGRDVAELLSLEANKERPTLENHFFADRCTDKQPMVNAVGRSTQGDRLSLEVSASYAIFDDDVLITWVVRDVGFINDLKRQSNLSQRLEGIGELAAGIAHEINTPIQFVFENAKFLGEAYEAIHRVLSVHEEFATLTPELEQALAKSCAPEQLSFYRQEVPVAIDEMKTGAWRIGEIVAAIREFSHPGTGDLASVNLNCLVATAVTVTANNCKYVAEVKCYLDESLPVVPCFRGQIAQVMVNLIVNAADAIAEKRQQQNSETGSIEIKTWADDRHVYFSVKDTGLGIPEIDREKVFLPFYTTKQVGKGTGQGLAITHAIVVENHKGTIDVESEVGVGSKFTVRLPR